MVAKAFVDTNILLRMMIPEMPLHEEAEKLVQKMWSEGFELWISRQIIREYLVQITHPKTNNLPVTVEQIDNQIQQIQSLFRIADETQTVTAQLIALLKTYPTGGKQIHDANIIATMMVYGIDTLLTINVEDMKRFRDKIKIIPLA